MTTENVQTASEKKPAKPNGQTPPKGAPRVLNNPNDVASLVLMQIDAVNSKKDDLTIAIKGLADTAKQLVRAYAQQAAAIQKLTERIRKLEEKEGKGSA